MTMNLITDVPGLAVGHAESVDALSGVTVVRVDQPAVASGLTRGGAPGTRDTTLLEPEMTIDGVDAIVLSGGSLFGLDAAGGVVAHLRDQGIGLRIGNATVPIAAQAIIFDLLSGGEKDWGRTSPYFDLGWQASAAAMGGPFALGSVGAGLGATTAVLKGGLGSASTVTASGYRVGALAVVNAVGSATIGDTAQFWAAPYEVGDEFGGLGFPEQLPSEALRLVMKGGAPPSTTIAVVATDAVLTKAQAKRVAHMADDGLARAVRPAHAPMDGDTVFVVATCRVGVTDPILAVTEIGQGAADCLARAIARGVFEAKVPSEAYRGPPAWRDRHRS
ncbi:MAG: P1 family peptidase [Hyphomicrobiaceae bacterium]